jgi:hypothetical protein
MGLYVALVFEKTANFFAENQQKTRANYQSPVLKNMS